MIDVLIILYLLGILASILPISMIMLNVPVKMPKQAFLIVLLDVMMIVLWPLTWLLFFYIVYNLQRKSK